MNMLLLGCTLALPGKRLRAVVCQVLLPAPNQGTTDAQTAPGGCTAVTVFYHQCYRFSLEFLTMVPALLFHLSPRFESLYDP
jgi:hypothetical protein